MLMDGGDDMKNYKKMVIKVDETIASELIANDSDDFDGQDLNEDDQTYYLKDPIEKDDYMIHEGRIVYGKNLVVLDPQRSFITIRETFRSGDLVMNFETGEFFRNEEKLNLSYIEQFLLEIFVRNANRILSREQIISMFESISKKGIVDNTLSVYISRLRKALGTYKGMGYIKTYHKLGYKWNHKIR